MALAPKPFVLQDAVASGLDPQPISIDGLPTGVDPQAAPTIDDSPADAAAVAADLQAVVDALVAAGVFTE
jgi:hypothetical protein